MEHAGLPSRQRELFCKDKNASGHAQLSVANLSQRGCGLNRVLADQALTVAHIISCLQ